jgi:hypothetical protein
MDSFEEIMAMLLGRDGFWTCTAFKVELTKEEKVQIGRYSSPRWEVDVIAYRPAENLLRVVECKSYLDSRGVLFEHVSGGDEKAAERYKLFTDGALRAVVFGRLVKQLAEKGLCMPNPKTQLCLATGKLAMEKDRQRLKDYFERNGWVFYDDQWIRAKLTELSECGYMNSGVAVTAKLLLRNR